jgi:hypothetical protein
MWVCRCDCGTERVVLGNSLLRGHTTSCGCAARDALIKRNIRHGLHNQLQMWNWA